MPRATTKKPVKHIIRAIGPQGPMEERRLLGSSALRLAERLIARPGVTAVKILSAGRVYDIEGFRSAWLEQKAETRRRYERRPSSGI